MSLRSMSGGTHHPHAWTRHPHTCCVAALQCGDCGGVHFPFGRAHLADLRGRLGPDVPVFSLPIVPPPCVATPAATAVADAAAAAAAADDGDPRAGEMERLVESLESSLAAAEPVELPHGLGFHEKPHWPLVLAMAEQAASRR